MAKYKDPKMPIRRDQSPEIDNIANISKSSSALLKLVARLELQVLKVGLPTDPSEKLAQYTESLLSSKKNTCPSKTPTNQDFVLSLLR